MLPITRASLQSFCRTCLKEFDKPTKKQQTTTYNIESTDNLSKWLATTCAAMQLRGADDTFPRCLCHVCYAKVRTFFEFREKTLCSVEALKELLAEDLEEPARKNLQMFCRTCLKKLKSIKNVANVFETPNVANWLHQCMGLHVNTDDFKEFPKLLCLWCFKKLRNYVEFREVAMQSCDYLENVVGSKNYSEVKTDGTTADKNSTNLNTTDGEEGCKLSSGILAEVIKTEPILEQTSIHLPVTETVFAEKLPIFKESFSDEDKDVGTVNSVINGHEIVNENSIKEEAEVEEKEEKENEKDTTSTKKIGRTRQNNIAQKSDNPEEGLLTPCKEQIFSDEETSVFACSLDEDSSDYEERPKSTKGQETTKRISTNVTRKRIKEKKGNTIDKPRKKIKCNQCERTFIKAVLCEAHVQAAHMGLERPFECTTCKISFRMYYYLKRHMREKHAISTADSKSDKSSAKSKNLINECKICRRVFKRKEHLKDHHRSVHLGIRPFKCNACEKTFATRKTCRVHEMGHTGERPFGCVKCDKTFRQKSELKIHLEKHSENKELLCPICKRIKSSREELDLHIEQHIASQQHQCPKCGRIFKKISHLNEHDRAVHLKLRPHKCSYCELSFALAKTRRTHERTHTGERPELCPLCDQSFKQRSVLSNHMKRYHSTEAERTQK